MAKQKKIKEISSTFWAFNIKLQSPSRKGEDAYINIVKDLFFSEVAIDVKGGKLVSFKTLNQVKMAYNHEPFEVIHGKIVRFSNLEGEWYDSTKREYVKHELPNGIFPNGMDTDFIFVPKAHRMLVAASAKVSINYIQSFLQVGLSKFTKSNEAIIVNIIKSRDSIDAILKANSLSSLFVDVSITNDDAGDKAQQAIDKMLKDANISEIKADIKSTKDVSLDTRRDIIRGLIELSKENGYAIASITNAEGKKQRITTTESPAKIRLKYKDEGEIPLIKEASHYIMNTYRNEPGEN